MTYKIQTKLEEAINTCKFDDRDAQA